MRTLRTDLALERHAQLANGVPEGIVFTEEPGDGYVLTKIEVLTDAAAEVLGKPKGAYYTVSLEAFPDSASLTDGRLAAVTQTLTSLLPPSGGVLVAGLGNTAVTPDALGPKCAGMVLATRHIDRETQKRLSLPHLREVSVLAPGVTGQTGLEAAEIIAGMCEKVKPGCVIAVDALAAAGTERLVKTVQISSSGIEPGSGVGNARRALNAANLGVPVISVGVPTVVDALSLARDVFDAQTEAHPAGELAQMMVTPRDIDTVVDSAARLLALAINCALQKNLSSEELLGLM